MTDSIVIVNGAEVTASAEEVRWAHDFLAALGYTDFPWKRATEALQRNAAIFGRTADYLEQPGHWIRNQSELLRRYRGREVMSFCATGAIGHFWQTEYVKRYRDRALQQQIVPVIDNDTLPAVILLKWLSLHPIEWDFNPNSTVEAWNDRPGRDKRDVVRAFRACKADHDRCIGTLLAMGKDMPTLFPVKERTD